MGSELANDLALGGHRIRLVAVRVKTTSLPLTLHDGVTH